MSKRETYEAKTEEILLPIAEENGVEIYDVEYVKEGSDWYLRAYIDKPDGVNIGDCEAVSRALSDKLDEADFIEDVPTPAAGRVSDTFHSAAWHKTLLFVIAMRKLSIALARMGS